MGPQGAGIWDNKNFPRPIAIPIHNIQNII